MRILRGGELLEKKRGLRRGCFLLILVCQHHLNRENYLIVAGVCEGKDADGDSTAGFGYSFSNDVLRDYGPPAGYDEVSGCFVDFMQPLVKQPGDVFEYGALSFFTSFSLTCSALQDIYTFYRPGLP